MRHEVGASSSLNSLLVINGGSSSIRFAVYDQGERLNRSLNGKVEIFGLKGEPRMRLVATDSSGNPAESASCDAGDSRSTTDFLIDWLDHRQVFTSVEAVGHRVVHGMLHSEPERVTAALIDELVRITPYDPDHLPLEIELIKTVQKRFPSLLQVACFDTSFHHSMPRVAQLLAIPRRFEGKGVRRYGFHGLSYEFLMRELARLGDPAATRGRVVLAHLGSGASLAAVLDGKSIDTSMGFTPTSGLVMGTRSGDLDPGLVSYLARTVQMDAAHFQKMVNHDSGLLGVSETSPDVRDLLNIEKRDVRALEAVALFCYQVKKWIGAFSAALGGIDTLVFSGGIGENSPVVRARICAGLEFLGLKLEQKLNLETANIISSRSSSVTVRVIRTDEQQMIAKSVFRILGLTNKEKA